MPVGLADNLFRTLLAMPMICVLTVPPGWLALRVLRRRQEWHAGRSVWMWLPVMMLVGMYVYPLVTVWLGLLIPLTTVGRGLVWLGLNGVLYGLGTLVPPPEAKAPPLYSARWQPFALLAVGLLALVITLLPLLLNAVEVNDWYVRISMADWRKHIEVTRALVWDDDLPPANPFLITEDTLRYYYHSYITPSTVVRLTGGGVDAVSSLRAWAGLIALAFPFVVYIYGREVGLTPPAALVSASLVTLVGGLDFMYVLEKWAPDEPLPDHIDAWADHGVRRINSINDMFIWTPQHILALAGFVIVLWLIHRLAQAGTDRPRRWLLGGGIGVMVACLPGISAFVWFGTVASLGAALGFEALRALRIRQPNAVWPVLGFALALGLVLSLPQIILLRGTEESGFEIAVNATVPGIRYGAPFIRWLDPGWLRYTLDFPGQMTYEFGLVMLTGVMGWWGLRKAWGRLEVRMWTIMLPVFFFIVLAVRHGEHVSNNFAARVAPMAWLILGIMSGYWWMARPRWRRWLRWPVNLTLLVWLAVGIASTLYEPYAQQGKNYVRLLGFKDSPPWNAISLDQTHYAVYEWLDDNLDTTDVYQFNRESEWPLPYYVRYRMALSHPFLAKLYISDEAHYTRVVGLLDTGYGSQDAAESAHAFASLGVNVVVAAKHEDDGDWLRAPPIPGLIRIFSRCLKTNGISSSGWNSVRQD